MIAPWWFRFRKLPEFLTFICRGKFPSLLLYPSTRQGVHLAASHENSTLRRVWIFFFPWRQVSLKQWVSPGLLMEPDLSRMRKLAETIKDRFIAIGFDFATILSSSLCSCILFAIVLEQPIKLEFSAQRVELKWLMMNKWKKLFHWSRVKLLLVTMSASWWLLSMYLIWILESRLIRSNNQSSATLWVLDTCFIVGFQPLIIILITAWLSSQTNNIALEPESFTFDRDQYWLDRDWCAWLEFGSACWVVFFVTSFPVTLQDLWLCWLGLVENEILQSPSPQRSRAGIPSMREPASREITSASVELCDTDVCFLHIQLVGTNVWLPKMHRIPPDVDFESSRSPAKSMSWNSPRMHCCAVFPTGQ